MFHLVFAMPALYVMGRTIWPLPWLLAVKVAVAILLLLASHYQLYSRISSGSVFVAEMPRRAVIQ